MPRLTCLSRFAVSGRYAKLDLQLYFSAWLYYDSKMQQQNGNNDPHSFSLPFSNRKVDKKSTSPIVRSEALKDREEKIAEAFANDGFFVLRQSFDVNVLLPFRDFANTYFAQCFRDLHDHGHVPVPSHRQREPLPIDPVANKEDIVTDGSKKKNRRNYTYTLQQGVPNGFREIVMRSPGRYELSLLHLDWMCEDENINQKKTSSSLHRLEENILLLVEPMKSLLPRLVGPDYTRWDELKLCHLSLLIATPGSSDQSWHADGGHVNVSKHLPCHCFNVFFPLQDTPKELGPTEIRASSQFLTRNLGPMMLAAKCRKTLRSPVWPELAFGDAIVLDYRVLHRGRANRSDDDAISKNNNEKFPARNRNYLVLSYSEPWFEDILNFPKRSLYDTKQHTT